jgi:hypothetical protein
MERETDLSSKWAEAYRLRQEAKNIVLSGGISLTGELERQMFKEADKRIDAYYAEKRKKAGEKTAPKWEKDWSETWQEHGDVTLFERKRR